MRDQLQSVTRRKAVASEIRRRVTNHEYPAGERLKDTELAMSLGVSRATLREALRELVFEGILVDEPYKGLRVARVDADALLDLARVRVPLETIAATRLSEHLTPEADTAFERSLAALEVARRTGDADALYAEHSNFHRLIYERSGVRILAQIWPLIDGQVQVAMGLDQRLRTDFKKLVDYHRDFVGVIRSRDSTAIAAHVAEHILSSTNELTANLRKDGATELPGPNDGSTTELEGSSL